jgi:acyl transferase domain-containing protein/acyl carrier protein
MTQNTSTPDYRALMTKALLELKELKAKVRRYEDERDEPIAIIGMACRFPGGANSPDQFWDLLRNGVDAISEIPNARWDVERFYDPDRNAPGKAYTRFGGFIDDIGGFDAGFFGISPREADSLDPHQRILLEVCWEALEQANLVPERLFGSNSGVFVGVSSLDQIMNRIGEVPLTEIGPYHGTGCALAPIAGRVSYIFGFNGPSFVVDTACSSSLLTLHLAAESLRRRECNLALAGGVHFLFHPGYFVAFSKAGMLAPDGRCKTFDAAANGYARGEGCGIMVLKRLSDAQRDGDDVLALLRGSAVNQDGASGGLTVPSGPSQEQVVRQALARAGVTPERVSYIEAHGTGTPLGDPIEIGALGNVFRQPLIVGSVKTNIGHLEASAGIAGAMKVTLALRHRTIPPHLHLKNPNPLIPWSDLSITVPTSAMPWTSAGNGDRVAGISAFAFSGTNVHVVLSEAPAATPSEQPAATTGPFVLPLSARSDESVLNLVRRWAEGPLAGIQEASDWRAWCATVAACRSEFNCRLTIVANDVSGARTAITDLLAGRDNAAVVCGTTMPQQPRVAFLFTGQGAQYVGMGRGLYATEPVFRSALDECDHALRAELGYSIVALMHSVDEMQEPQSLALDATANTQPALFAIEYALARLWQSWGIEPAAVCGHSVGEYVAACIAGVFSLADGVRLIAARGRLMQALPAGGAMAALFAPAEEVDALVAQAVVSGALLAVAAYNGPRNTVVSGSQADLTALLEHGRSLGMESRRLVVSHAFHSPLMEPMLAEFATIAAQINYLEPKIPLISNVTGCVAGNEVTQAAYWVGHVRAAVRFAGSVTELVRQGCSVLLEVGPHATLTAMAAQNIEDPSVYCLASLRRGNEDALTLRAALGAMWTYGVAVDWSLINGAPRRDLRLPTYAFNHRQYWQTAQIDAMRHSLHGVETLGLPLLTSRLRSPVLRDALFETVFSRAAMPFIEDHRVFGRLVVAGASHLSLVLSAVGQTLSTGNGACRVAEVMFPAALVVPEEGECVVQLAVSQTASELAEFRLVSLREDGTEAALHARGKASARLEAMPSSDLRAIWLRCADDVPVDAVYRLQQQRHISVGPSYQWLLALRRGDGEVMAKLRMPAQLDASIGNYSLHPGLIDSCFGAMVMARELPIDETFIPFALQSLTLYPAALGSAMRGVLLAHAYIKAHDAQRMVGDIHLYTDEGEPIACFVGLEGRRASRHALLAESSADVPACYALQWIDAKLPALKSSPHGHWLVFAITDDAASSQLLVALAAQGMWLTVVHPDATDQGLQRMGDGVYRLAPTLASGFADLLTRCGELDGIAYLWGLSSQSGNDLDALAGALHLLQAVAVVKTGTKPMTLPLMLATKDTGVQRGLLWGLVQTARAENDALRLCTVELSSHQTAVQGASALQVAMGHAVQGRDLDLAWREEQWLAARLRRIATPAQQTLEHGALLPPELVCIVTGASGGIGRALTLWLAQQGVHQFALLSRSGIEPAQMDALAALGAQARSYHVDVAECVALAAVLDEIARAQGSPGAVFHLAGQLDDGLLDSQSWPRVQAVVTPKFTAAWNLHQLTQGMPLRHFVLFSSLAGVLGSAGQAGYAAANGGLDALARLRRTAGLPALAINWGPWAGDGMAALLDKAQRARLDQRGVHELAAEVALAQLGRLLGAVESLPPSVAVLAMEWDRFVGGQVPSLLVELATTSGEQEHTLQRRLLETPVAERKALLLTALTDLVAEVLRLQRSEVAPRQRLFDLGIDSLIAVELKNRLQSLLGTTLSATLLFDYPTLDALADHLLEQLAAKAGAGLATTAPSPTPAALPDDLAALSEEEAEALLLAQLEQLEGHSS